MDKMQRLMQLNGVRTLTKPKETVVEISRFEYDLLEITYANTIYRIMEDDGRITTLKGEY